GAGMIGLALVQALSRAGCGRLVVVDVAKERLQVAKQFGATNVMDASNSDVPGAVMELTGGKGADVVFEAVGLNGTVQSALSCLRKGGAATLVGNVTPRIEFPLQVVVTRELTVRGTCASKGDYPACLDMLARGDLNASPLISATASLSEGAAWFDRLYRREPGLLKVVLVN
ncbi:MAG TPA: zinc-binding dehydrogenase, partial [Clostridia bacterium]|nr:zinc-binding dehydrogenase [Clostridia bacterium]